MTLKSKRVLILHGWPQPVEKDSVNNVYAQYFENRGYEVITPKLFSNEFDLTVDGINLYISQVLKNKPLDIIVGISMGTLILPLIAKNYPKAKLVFIAGGANLKPKSLPFKFLIKIASYKTSVPILEFVRHLPKSIVLTLYKLINPFSGNYSDKSNYLKDMATNYKYMVAIPAVKEREIINFATAMDNTNLLKNLKNKTIIFSGKGDLLMPCGENNILHSLLTNSTLIENNCSHFEVFKEENFKDLDKFLA